MARRWRLPTVVTPRFMRGVHGARGRAQLARLRLYAEARDGVGPAMLTVDADASEAGARLSSLLERVERGGEVTITRHGRAVARLVPAAAADRARVDAAIARLRALRAGSSLGGLSWRELRDEGRP